MNDYMNWRDLYNLQSRVENEIEKAVNALQNREIKELISILEFLNQYDIQLESDYMSMLENIDNCR
jgi:hypothetical protein